MSKVLLFIPQTDLADNECWQSIRQWMKVAGLTWDKVRCTPASIYETSVKQNEVKAALNLLRQGSFEKVVFAKLPANYETNLDWLMFAISCQTQKVKLETLEGELTLPPSAQKLAAHYSSMSKKAAQTQTQTQTPASAKSQSL
ncbi:MAG: hypothetical protein H7249_19695 [Chitinophagaceae bacterium]|nr:hypothetical protein [Oligoflexus sp.]